METDLAEIDKNQITSRRGKGKKRKSKIDLDRNGFLFLNGQILYGPEEKTKFLVSNFFDFNTIVTI